MIESVRIENFRAFGSAEVSGLGRINLLVGDNRAGKTSFLEALFLTSGNNIENHLKELHWRGVFDDQIPVSSTDVKSGALWSDLFHRFDQGRGIKIIMTGHPRRALFVDYREPDEVSVLPVGRSNATAASSVEAPIVFTWEDATGKTYSIRPRLDEQKGLVAGKASPGIGGAMIPDAPINAKEAADRFSKLDIAGGATPVVEAIRAEFREITELSTQPIGPSGSMIYARVKDVRNKIPLPMISAGINRWVFILSTIVYFRDGAVFVDELEKGVHHERLGGFWRSIVNCSEKSNTQVFAATHSLECLNAVVPSIESDPAAFRLLRFRVGGKIEVVDGKHVIAAIKEGFEVR